MRYFCILLFLSISVQAFAQDRTRAILVMDGSGSMWGQIDGVAKITIAQEVVANLLGELPEQQELGLTIYGHRRKGDCSDIETVVEPGADTRGAIGSAVNAISPRGKTPMTDAVIAAAKALRYTEEKATVILVSDGIETCAPDPCAAARALEEAGVDFTAHVVGFDVSGDADAIAQMQCIADETGGTFRTASNAAELTEALAVVAEPEPEYSVELVATEGEGGPRITEGLVWDIGNTATGPWLTEGDTSASHLIDQLPEGTLFARVTRTQDGASAEREFRIDENTPDILALALPELPPDPVTLRARAFIESTGNQITEGIVWSMFAEDGQGIVENAAIGEIVEDVLPGTYRIEVLRIEDESFDETTIVINEDDPNALAKLELPEILRPVRLSFEARLTGSGKLIRRDLSWSVVDRDGTSVYEGIGVGEQIETMPGRYTIAAMRSEDGAEVSQEIALTKNGKKVVLEFPPYEALATLAAPVEAPVGSFFLVDWTGPNEKNDYVAIAKLGDKPNSYDNYEYTRQGPTLELTMPSEPGEYEVRYYMAKEGRVVATVLISATPVTATLSAPDEAPIGSMVDVEWTGPGYQNDYIDVSKIGADDTDYVNYQYTRKGSPAGVEMPIEPGTYQLRYVMAQGKNILASREIVITEETFEISGPTEAVAGATIPVDWIGPNLANDFISVAEVGSKGSEYASYQYTRKGSPADIVLPMEPGTYEIRYIVSQDKQSMASYELVILPVTGSIAAAETVAAGDVIDVTWDGPGYQKDFVAIAETGANISKYLSYEYTRQGDRLEVQAPSQPGEYELRYIAHSQGTTLLASQPLTVTDVSATVSGPARAAAGSEIEVTWEGPGYHRDYVAIFAEGEEKRYVTYSYTRRGGVLKLKAPDEPGVYELRYIMGQDARKLSSMPLIVE